MSLVSTLLPFIHTTNSSGPVCITVEPDMGVHFGAAKTQGGLRQCSREGKTWSERLPGGGASTQRIGLGGGGQVAQVIPSTASSQGVAVSAGPARTAPLSCLMRCLTKGGLRAYRARP